MQIFSKGNVNLEHYHVKYQKSKEKIKSTPYSLESPQSVSPFSICIVLCDDFSVSGTFWSMLVMVFYNNTHKSNQWAFNKQTETSEFRAIIDDQVHKQWANSGTFNDQCIKQNQIISNGFFQSINTNKKNPNERSLTQVTKKIQESIMQAMNIPKTKTQKQQRNG